MNNIFPSVQGVNDSRQLALGVAFGIFLGLIPKDNLVFVSLLIVLILSQANLLVAAISSVSMGFVSAPMTPTLDLLGQRVLSQDLALQVVSNVFRLPLGPWSNLDNSVVVGAVLIGLLSFIPIFSVSLIFFDRFRKPIKSFISKGPLAPFFLGEDLNQN